MTPFNGFPPQAFRFLAQLARNNDKVWFDAHRDQYEESIFTPSLAFVTAMGAALQRSAPSVVAEPRIGGSLFRIHRDTRFAADKRPYKTHVGIRLRDGDTARSSQCSGPLFYIEFDATQLRLGTGIKEFDPQTLTAYRAFVASRQGATALNKFVQRANSHGDETLARAPRPYTTQADNDLLKRKGLFVSTTSSLPQEIHNAGFVDYCVKWFTPYVPLFQFLREIAIDAAGT